LLLAAAAFSAPVLGGFWWARLGGPALGMRRAGAGEAAFVHRWGTFWPHAAYTRRPSGVLAFWLILVASLNDARKGEVNEPRH